MFFKYRDVTSKAPVHISCQWVISAFRGMPSLSSAAWLPAYDYGRKQHHSAHSDAGTFLFNIHLFAPKAYQNWLLRRAYNSAIVTKWSEFRIGPPRCSTSFFHLSSRTKSRPLYDRLKQSDPWGWIKMRRCAEAVPESRVEGAGMKCTTSSSQTFSLAWREKRNLEFGRLLIGVC